MLAVIGMIPALVAVNPVISPVPLADSPMDGSEFVQVKVVPPTGPVTAVKGTVAPLQKVWFDMGATVAVGLTVMV